MEEIIYCPICKKERGHRIHALLFSVIQGHLDVAVCLTCGVVRSYFIAIEIDSDKIP